VHAFAFTADVYTSAILKKVEAIEIKIYRRRHLQWHILPGECHENIQILSHTDRQIDRQTDDLLCLSFIFLSKLG
jgi:hypothetical protein